MSEDANMRIFGNRYQAVKLIGAGGMAEVYKAADTVLNRGVAVKVLLPQFANDPTFVSGFLDEARAAARLNNPHIVGIYDWGQDEDGCYIIMEYVRGIDLRRAVRAQGAVHPKRVAEIAAQVCTALDEAHRADIIHRDIKSANIMMQASGDVKLMDFGIASRTSGANALAGKIAGTVQYMSPEQACGKRPGPPSDLYSLGIVMYELCTGTLPFHGANTQEIARQQVEAAPVAPGALSDAVDTQLEAIILKSLEKNPDDRYASALDMKRALDSYIANWAPGAAPDNMPKTLWALAFTKAPVGLAATVHTFDAPITLGRSSACTVTVNDPSVSRRHMHIAPRGRYLEIRDLNSSNGFYVNGVAAPGRALCQPGDSVRIGGTEFKIGCNRTPISL